MVDARDRIRACNAGAARLFGRRERDLLGKSVATLLAPHCRARYADLLGRGGHCAVDLAALRADGSELPIALSATELESELGGQRHRALVVNDVIERARNDVPSGMAHERIEAASCAHGELLAEIRDGRQRERAAAIRRNRGHLAQRLDHIEDLSHLESGRTRLQRRRVSVAELLRRVVDLAAARVADGGASIRVGLDGLVPDHIVGDPVWLQRLLSTLVGRALRLAGDRPIWLRAALERGADRAFLRLSVEQRDGNLQCDRHPMRPASVEPVGDAGRGSQARALESEICGRLAGLMGASIEIDTTCGDAADFTLRVPTGPIDERRLTDSIAPRRDTPPAARSLRSPCLSESVLVVDDDSEIRELLCDRLRRRGARVRSAANGREALQAARSARYDVILMDMQMPVLDGICATRAIRDFGFSGRILALAERSMLGDGERCLSAGCDAYVRKPVDIDELVLAIRDASGDDDEGARTAPPSEEPRGGKLRVLIVDDNAGALDATVQLLALSGYDAQGASDGAGAIPIALDWRPHVVILDLGLPDIDGFEVLDRLRSQPTLAHTRFIALSGRSDSETRVRALASGFDHFVVKPARIEELEALFG